MNFKRLFLLCAVIFFLVIAFMIWRSDRLGPHDMRDPSTLPPPSRQFNEWRKQWEKQR